MPTAFSSTLLLTLLMVIGLVFFLRAASKDRTTVLDFHSKRPAIEVLEGLSRWLEERGWQQDGGDRDRQLLRFRGQLGWSRALAMLLSALGAIGAGCLGLVLQEIFPALGWWPILLVGLGPLAGIVYAVKASRQEAVELRLLSDDDNQCSSIRLKAHRDELIALENELAEPLGLASDGSLLSSPI